MVAVFAELTFAHNSRLILHEQHTGSMATPANPAANRFCLIPYVLIQCSWWIYNI